MVRKRHRNKIGSIKHQVNKELNKITTYGVSKHELKKQEKERCIAAGEKWNPARVPGIVGVGTRKTYEAQLIRFGKWCKEEYGIKDITKLTKEHANAWLKQSLQDKNSNHTIRTKGAALAKFFGCKSNEFGIKMPSKKTDVITRSRGPKAHDKHFSEKIHEKEVNFGKATGLRRKEITLLMPKQIFKDSQGKVYIEFCKEKYGHKQKRVDLE